MDAYGSVDGRQSHSESSDLLRCTPCSLEVHTEQIPPKAEGFCSVCREYLCSTCTAYHKKLRITRDHPIVDVNKAESSVEENNEKVGKIVGKRDMCEKHADEIKFYCQNHEVFGCGVCTTLEHNSCQLDYIPEAASRYKDSEEFKSLVRSVDQLDVATEKFEVQLNDQEIQAEDVKNKTVELTKQFRSDMTNYLDMQESSLLKTAECLNESNHETILDLKKDNSEIKKQVLALKQDLEKWTDDPEKLFMVSKVAKGQLQTIETKHSEMTKVAIIKEFSLKLNSTLQNFLDQQCAIGEIKIDGTNKTSEVQDDLSATEISVVDHFNVNGQGDKKKPWITGLAALPNGNVVAADRNNSVLKLVDIGAKTIISTLVLPGRPFDVTMMHENQIAVSMPDLKKIRVLSADLSKISFWDIDINVNCYGICFRRGKLFSCCKLPNALKVIDLYGTETSYIDLGQTEPSYVVLDTSLPNVYISGTKGAITVVEIGNDSVLSKTIKVHMNLDELCGLTTPHSNQLVVCDKSNKRLCLFSYEDSKLVLKKEWTCDKQFPRAIDFCPTRKMFVLSCKDKLLYLHSANPVSSTSTL